MKKAIILFVCSVVSSLALRAQMYVTTLGSGNCSLGEAVCDDYGNIFFCDRSSCSQIKKIDTSGTVSTYASTPGQDPASLILDTNGNLYVAYHWSPQNKIVRIPPGGGTPVDYVTNIPDVYGSSALLFDNDTMYFGEYSTQRIYKVLPGGGAVGSSNVIPIQPNNLGISGVSNERLFDLQWMADGNILAVVKNKFYKVDRVTGVSTLLATYPTDVTSAAIVNGTIYFTMWAHHHIYAADTITYTHSIFAGTGTQGTLDGTLNTAQFSYPDHITTDNFGNLIVTEYGSGKVRRIWGCHAISPNLTSAPLCVNDTLFLGASPTGGNYNTYTYQWSHANGFSANTKDTFMLVNPGLFNTYVHCQITDLLGCNISDSVLIKDLSSASTINVNACGSYTSPSGNYTWTSSGLYTDTISNVLGCDSIISVNLTINQLPNVSVTQNGNVLTANQSGANYQWVDCDSLYAPITAAAQQNYSAAYNGNFAVIVTLNGCADTSSCYNINVSGINEPYKVITWSIYPNPSNGQFTIQSDKESVFELTDITGRVINSYKINGKLDVSESLPAGMYFVRDRESGMNQKLIIKD